MPLIGKYEKEPIRQKLLFFISTMLAHYLFISTSDYINKNKRKIKELTDKCLLGSFAILFGLLIYYDLEDSTSVIKFLPNIEEIYQNDTFRSSVIISPAILINLLRIILYTPF